MNIEEKEVVKVEVVGPEKEVEQALKEFGKIDEEREIEIRNKINHMRVNFEDPQSIIYYGSEIIDEVVNLLHNISSNSNESSIDSDMLEYSKKVEKVTNFTKNITIRS